MNPKRDIAQVILAALMSLCVLFYVASSVFLLALVVSESAAKIADAIKGSK